MQLFYFALAWVLGSAAAALVLGRWVSLRPLHVVEDDGGVPREPQDDLTRQEGDLDLDDQPVSRMKATSRAESGRDLRSSRSA